MKKQLIGLGILLSWIVTSAHGYSGGMGTPDSPYQIGSIQDLLELASVPNEYDQYFVLTTNLDLSEYSFNQAIIASDINEVDEPEDQGFTGTFDGQGYVISGLRIEGHDYLGLFGCLGQTAQVMNLGLKQVDVNGVDIYSGSLAGINYGSIDNCFAEGTVSGRTAVGGLIGFNYGIISQCYAVTTVIHNNQNGSLVFNQAYGGLIGYNTGTVTECYSAGNVTGYDLVGGLIGYHDWGHVTNCHSTAVTEGVREVGGLIGLNCAHISNSYSLGHVLGEDLTGGLIGCNWGFTWNCYSMGNVVGTNETTGGLIGEHYGYLWKAYSTSNVSGANEVGGLVGANTWGGSISGCFSTGAVTGQDMTGGLVGKTSSWSFVYDSFWDTETSGLSHSEGGMGLPTSQMQNLETYLDAGWDFMGETDNGTCNYWYILPQDYPRLPFTGGASPVMPDGEGTIESPYLVKTVTDLGTLWFEPRAHYRLENDLDLQGITWNSAVVPWFSGSLNGNGHTLSHLSIESDSDFLGLFGYTEASVIISNLNLTAVDINGLGYLVGALVGDNQGEVANCTCEGVIQGENSVGGLIGSNIGQVSYCQADIEVSGDHHIGGLIGYSGGEIDHCYASGVVNGGDNTGGLIANSMGGPITHCSGEVNVTGKNYVGGLLGYNNFSKLVDCNSTGEVTGQEYVGGLLGYNSSEDPSKQLVNCHAVASVSGANEVGGLIGHNEGWLNVCFSKGDVTGKQETGGLIGYNEGTLYNCYSLTSVQGESECGGLVGTNTTDSLMVQCFSTGLVTGTNHVGGLVGVSSEASSPHCFWDIEASGQNDSADGTGLTTAQMLTPETFIAAGWDFVNETLNGTCDYWSASTGQYPLLCDWTTTTLPGDGTTRYPYLIATPSDLGQIWRSPLAHYRLACSLDLSNIRWSQPVSSYFQGSFDGQGFSLENFKMQGSGGLGLFGSILRGSEISNLNITGLDIHATHDDVGGLASRAESSTFKNCSLQGTIRSRHYVGGLAGQTERSTLENCTLDVTLSGVNYVGGLVGTGYRGTSTQCHNYGDINANDYCGGLAGTYLGGYVNDCHNHGTITGQTRIGGLVGISVSLINHCSNNGSVTGYDCVGGLVSFGTETYESYNTGTITGHDRVGGLFSDEGGNPIDHCFNRGDVSGHQYIGGLVGYAYGPRMTDCYSSANVNGSGDYVGGLFGYGSDEVEGGDDELLHCYSTGTIKGHRFVGGLVGRNAFSNLSECYSSAHVTGSGIVGGLLGDNGFGTIQNCYSIGDVSGIDYVGGFAGNNYTGTMIHCYSTGEVSGSELAGGFIGLNYDGTVTDCFWDTQASGWGESHAGTGLTTTEMQEINSFLDAGWDFADEMTNGTDDPWTMPSHGYPLLTWELN